MRANEGQGKEETKKKEVKLGNGGEVKNGGKGEEKEEEIIQSRSPIITSAPQRTGIEER